MFVIIDYIFLFSHISDCLEGNHVKTKFHRLIFYIVFIEIEFLYNILKTNNIAIQYVRLLVEHY